MKARLGDIFEIGSGGTPSKTHPEYYGGEIPWVKTGDLKEEYLFSVEDCITEEGLRNSSAKMYEPGTVLIAMYGATIGATSILNFEACTNQACAAFKPCKNVKPEYLYYFLRSKKQEFVRDGVGGAQPNISAGYLKRVQIDVRSIEEQDHIIAVLDDVNSIIKKRQKELELLDDLIKARFIELFGDPVSDTKSWGKKPLKEMLESIRYGTSTPPEFSDEGYAFIRATNIKNGRIVDNDMKYIPQQEADRLEKCRLSGGEIIIVRSGVNAGDTCVVTPEYIGQYAGYDMILVLNEMLNPVFLNTLINTSYMEKVVKPMTRRAAQPHLNSEQTQSLPIICVPIELQDEFADFVNQVDKSKFVVQKALDEAQLLFDSLMQQYFG